jgi:hypothetical protein
MTTVALVGFLAAHGLLHAGIWLPRFDTDAAVPPPFEPDRSSLLTLTAVPRRTARRVARALATLTTVAYLLAAVGVAAGAGWGVPAAFTAAVLGLVLKGLFFHPWLTIGVLLDVFVLVAAATAWPVTLG